MQIAKVYSAILCGLPWSFFQEPLFTLIPAFLCVPSVSALSSAVTGRVLRGKNIAFTETVVSSRNRIYPVSPCVPCGKLAFIAFMGTESFY
jgi:hypothetical protein